jgi:hypothetical protein
MKFQRDCCKIPHVEESLAWMMEGTDRHGTGAAVLVLP